MSEVHGASFKPKLDVFITVLGIFSIPFGLFLLWWVFQIYWDIFLQLFFLIMGLGGLYFGYYSLSFFWKVKLVISEKGILYKETFSTLYCEWPQIKGAAFSDKVFYLVPDEAAQPKRNRLKEFITSEKPASTFPIHLFVGNWSEQKDWDQEVLLKFIAFYLPGIANEIINGSKNIERKSNK